MINDKIIDKNGRVSWLFRFYAKGIASLIKVW